MQVREGDGLHWNREVVKEMERMELGCGPQLGMACRVKACGLVLGSTPVHRVDALPTHINRTELQNAPLFHHIE